MFNLRPESIDQAIFSTEEEAAEESFEESTQEPIPEPMDQPLPQTNHRIPMDIDEEPLPRPPRFLGDRNAVEPYIFHCLTNFASNPSRFPDEGRKVLYLLNNMGGYAYEWGSRLLNRYPTYSQNSEMFISRIRNTFGDPDLEYHHQRQFRSLKQRGIGNALDYVNNFRRLAIFVNIDENLLMDTFYQGLDPRLQERLDNIFPQPNNLDDLARLTVRLDRHMLQQFNRRNRNTNNRNNNSNRRNQANRINRRSSNETRNNQILRCSYCNRIGHTEDNCYHRQEDIRRQQGNVQNQASAISSNPINIRSTGPITSFLISTNNQEIPLKCLLDTGSFACFLNKEFADQHSIPYLPDPEVTEVHGIGGSSTVHGKTSKMPIRYKNYSSTVEFYVMDLSNNSPGIIGMNWIRENNLTFRFSNKEGLIINFPCDSSSKSQGSRYENFSSTNNPIEVATINFKSEKIPEIPEELIQLKEVFDERKPNCLPPHRVYDCSIDLKPNTTPFYGPLYQLTVEEQKALKEYIDENLAKGFIKPSKSPYGAPVMFVPKKDGSLRLVVDYRRLNQDTIRNSYPLPLIKDLLDRVQGCKYFSKLDLPGAYNLVRIREGDQPKTAFRTRFGHFEYEVMSFGLTNAPATFQFFLNDIFSDILDKYAYSFIDDVLIFSKTYDEHVIHVRTVLTILLENKLYCKLKKCEFFKSSIEFLGYIISDQGISMCQDKVKAIRDWPRPKAVKEIQQFLGLANFYRRFIKNFSSIVQPLTNLTKKNIEFVWSDTQENAFINLKNAFCSAPVLIIPDPNKAFVVETDASNFAIGAVLSQLDNENRLHPCVFMSKGLKNMKPDTIFMIKNYWL